MLIFRRKRKRRLNYAVEQEKRNNIIVESTEKDTSKFYDSEYDPDTIIKCINNNYRNDRSCIDGFG